MTAELCKASTTAAVPDGARKLVQHTATETLLKMLRLDQSEQKVFAWICGSLCERFSKLWRVNAYVSGGLDAGFAFGP